MIILLVAITSCAMRYFATRRNSSSGFRETAREIRKESVVEYSFSRSVSETGHCVGHSSKAETTMSISHMMFRVHKIKIDRSAKLVIRRDAKSLCFCFADGRRYAYEMNLQTYLRLCPIFLFLSMASFSTLLAFPTRFARNNTTSFTKH